MVNKGGIQFKNHWTTRKEENKTMNQKQVSIIIIKAVKNNANFPTSQFLQTINLSNRALVGEYELEFQADLEINLKETKHQLCKSSVNC